MSAAGAFERAVEIFSQVCDLSESERELQLKELCEGDDELEASVRDLLDADRSGVGFLQTPALGAEINIEAISATMGRSENAAPMPERIGRYRILSLLGRGGMGVVYRAEQERPKREVAVKVVSQGVHSDATVRRFEFEVQTLARLNHPGVARVFDAGIYDDEGLARPWFAMELVEGETLLKYCEANSLDVESRLRLFMQICDAVEHAHRNGIIHRDLKPANVIVNTEGEPKILDFGVARSLTGDGPDVTMLTETGQVVGTIAYMSPEQVRAEQGLIDTRTDVYSLGVILFEMLTGELPHDVRSTSLAEAARRVGHEPGRRLADVSRVFRGELDTIVRSAIEADVARRYQSAGDLQREIERHLNGDPILAHPPSAIYQIRKFATRNRGLFAALLLAAMSLVAGAVASTVLALRATNAEQVARTERDVARRESERANAVNEFLNGMVASADPNVAQGRDLTVRDLLIDAASRMGDSFDDQPLVEASLRVVIGGAFRNLGEFDRSMTHLRAAEEIFERVNGAAHPSTLNARSGQALVLMDSGRMHEAADAMRDVLRLQESVLGRSDPETLRTMNNLAWTLMSLGRHEQAIDLLEQVIAERQGDQAVDVIEAARAEINHIAALYETGDRESAYVLLEEARPRLNDVIPPAHPLRSGLLETESMLAEGRGEWEQALRFRRESFELNVQVLGPLHPETLKTQSRLAWGMGQRDQAVDALPLAQDAYEGLRDAFGDGHVQTLDAMNSLGAIHSALGDTASAFDVHRRQLEIGERELGPSHGIVTDAASNLGYVAFQTGDIAESERMYQRALDGIVERLGEDHPTAETARVNLSFVMHRRMVEIEDPQERAEYTSVRLDFVIGQHSEAPLRTVMFRETLAWALHSSGRHEDAVRTELELLEILLGGLPPTHERVIGCRSRIAGCLAELGRNEEARAELLAAIEAATEAFGESDERTLRLRERLDAM